MFVHLPIVAEKWNQEDNSHIMIAGLCPACTDAKRKIDHRRPRCQSRGTHELSTEDDTSIRTNVIDANAEGDTDTTWLQTIRNAAIQRTILDTYLWIQQKLQQLSSGGYQHQPGKRKQLQLSQRVRDERSLEHNWPIWNSSMSTQVSSQALRYRHHQHTHRKEPYLVLHAAPIKYKPGQMRRWVEGDNNWKAQILGIWWLRQKHRRTSKAASSVVVYMRNLVDANVGVLISTQAELSTWALLVKFGAVEELCIARQ